VRPADRAAGPGLKLPGPAGTDLRGGAATSGFELDGGKFSIAPPPPGDVPRVSRTLAECEELASIGANGFPLAGPYDDMMGIGYGLVTVSQGLTVNSPEAFPGMSAMPAPASFQDRLAWVLVDRNLDRLAAFCPAESASSLRATQKYVPPCDGEYKEAAVIPGTALVRVLAYGRVAASCGPPRPVSMYLLPAGVFETLPSTLVHAQTGLYITGTPNPGSSGSSPAPMKGKLVTVAGPSGQTITVPVGDVVVATPFPGPDPMHPDPVYSSDPAVLDRIGPPQLQNQMPWEFRALRPGQATLHCAFQNWTAHVIVVAV
jgi:hypothetical protein